MKYCTVHIYTKKEILYCTYTVYTKKEYGKHIQYVSSRVGWFLVTLSRCASDYPISKKSLFFLECHTSNWIKEVGQNFVVNIFILFY